MNYSHWSVRAQLMLLVAAVLFPALLGLGLFFAHEREQSLGHAYERVGQLARHTAAELGAMLREREELLARMAQRPLVRALDAGRCDPLIAEYTSLHPGFTNLVVRDLSGQNDCSVLAAKLTPAQQRAGLVPGYLEAQQREGLTVGPAHQGPLSGRWVSVLLHPVKDAQDKTAGMISLPMNLVALGERYLAGAAPDDLLMAIDQHGRIVLRSRDAEQWLGKQIPPDLLAGAVAGAPIAGLDVEGVARYWAAVAVPAANWHVLAGVPVDQVLAAPNRVGGVGLLLVLASLALALLAAWRVSLRLVRPIDALSHVAIQVAYGQTALRAQAREGPAEIASVAQAFNAMLDAREQAQQLLAASEERFRTLSALSSDWYWEQDEHYRFTRVGDAHPGSSGVPGLQILGKTRWDIPAPNLGEADWARHRALLEARQPFHDLELQRIDDLGRVLWNTVSGAPMFDAKGQFCGYRGVGIDITERKQQEQRRLALAARVEELSRGLVQAQEETRRRFAGELHDRTSPNLSALRINLATIASATPEARLTRAFIDRIEDTRALIDDTNASIREICAELHPAALEIGGLLAAVQSYAQQFAARTGLRVVVDCPRGDKRLAASLELSLFRIVQEALTNCVKHAQAKTVTVGLDLEARPMRVTVCDDGVGFDAARVLGAASRVGLGLLNMRELTEFIGGRFELVSSPDGGTQVSVDVAGDQAGL